MGKVEKTLATLGGVGTTMTALAGLYYLYGSDRAAQHRKDVSKWMHAAEREIIKEARRLKGLTYTDENIRRLIDAVAKKYEGARNLEPQDVRAFVSAMQENWQQLANSVKRDDVSRPRKQKTKAQKRTRKSS